MPDLLIAAPVHISKSYAFPRWLAAVNAIQTPHDTLCVDNSPDMDFVDAWRPFVPMQHIDVEDIDHADTPAAHKRNGWHRIARSMEQIRAVMLAGDYTHWLNIECDVIVPPYIAVFMLGNVGTADWLNVPYWSRDGSARFEYGFGCSLFSRRMIESEHFDDLALDVSPDGAFYDRLRARGLWRFEIVRSAIELEHLAE